MGPSGSGKTSLLNFLTNRIQFPRDSEHSGSLFLNSEQINDDKLSKISSYVMQDDLLLDVLTPRETLVFASKFRQVLTDEEVLTRVEILLNDLKLTKCADTIIGNENRKGISGGEKKRVSIGIEIISNPSIFFLDEPTSGLDSRTSFIIIDFLKELAAKYKKAIVFTIHQPSSNIVMLFHRLILLNKGELVYQGPNNGVIEHFETIGHSLDNKANPADAYMHKIESFNNKKNTILMDEYKNKLEAGVVKEIDDKLNSQVSGNLAEKNLENSGFWQATKLLFYRSYLNLVRNPLMLRIRVFMVILFSFITCSIFSFLQDGAIGAGNRTGFFFFFCINNFMQNIFSTITTFPPERAVFLREYSSNLYSVVPYFLGKTFVDTPVGLFFGLLYSLICYYIVGLRPEPQYYFIFCCIFVVLVFLAQGMGLLFGCAFTDFNTAMIVTQFSLMPAFLFSGFLINQENMPIWLAWLRFLSPFRYTMEAALRNEFDGVDVNKFQGANPVTQLNLDIGLWNCVIIMTCMGVGFRILACMLLRFLVRKTG
jgi:ABC-type multidrug transport system ATPase subunit